MKNYGGYFHIWNFSFLAKYVAKLSKVATKNAPNIIEIFFFIKLQFVSIFVFWECFYLKVTILVTKFWALLLPSSEITMKSSWYIHIKIYYYLERPY